MIAERYPGLIDLPDEDKMALIAELWENVVGEAPADDPAIAELVEQRWNEYQQHPERVLRWDEVKARVKASHP